MMEDEIRKCCICGKEFRISEIAKAYMIKGEKVYLCKGCQRIVRDVPDDDHDFHHQF